MQPRTEARIRSGRGVVRSLAGLLLVLLLWVVPSRAETTFRSEVSQQGGAVQLRFVLASDQALPRNLQPRFPEFKGFRKLSGPAIGTSISIVNGASSHETSWSFVLQPEAPGTLAIGAASVEVDGRLYTAPARQVKAAAQGGGEGGGEPAVFLRAEVSNSRPVVGEKVLLRYKLYYNTQIQGYDIEDLPSSAGFLKENLEDIQRPKSSNETWKGQDYNVAVIREIALFPTRDGRLEIPSLNARANVLDNRQRQRQRSMLDDFFGDPFRRVQTQILPSNTLSLEVQPLPPGAPVGFSGAVGQYSLKAAPDRTTLAAGEAITLTATVEGEGNLALLPQLEPQLSHGLEKYDTQQESSVRRAAGSFGGTKRFKTLIVARTEGEQEIGALTLVYYDPRARQYRTLSAGPWTLTVQPGSRSMTEGGPGIGVRAGKVESYGQDIRHILDTPAGLEPVTRPLHRHWAWRLALLAVALAPLAARWIAHRRRIDASDPRGFRRRRAAGEASRRLATARRALAKDQPAQALKALDDALAGYLADRLGRPAGELVLEELARELEHSGRLAAGPAAALAAFRRKLDLARYGSGGADARELARELVAEGEPLLKELRRQLEGGGA